jgi:hypothetical protein
MKRHRKENIFLEQLRTIPNISLACEKVGLSRNTIYRWCNEDLEFKKNLDEAISAGTESVNDLAESKLINHINQGNMQAIRYWLDNNKKTYIRPRPKNFWEMANDEGPITHITISRVDPSMYRRDETEPLTETVE